MKSSTQNHIGIQASQFTDTVHLLKEVFNLEMTYQDTEAEFVQFYLAEGQTMEVFGFRNYWHHFTNPPDWEVLIADIRQTRSNESYERATGEQI